MVISLVNEQAHNTFLSDIGCKYRVPQDVARVRSEMCSSIKHQMLMRAHANREETTSLKASYLALRAYAAQHSTSESVYQEEAPPFEGVADLFAGVKRFMSTTLSPPKPTDAGDRKEEQEIKDATETPKENPDPAAENAETAQSQPATNTQQAPEQARTTTLTPLPGSLKPQRRRRTPSDAAKAANTTRRVSTAKSVEDAEDFQDAPEDVDGFDEDGQYEGDIMDQLIQQSLDIQNKRQTQGEDQSRNDGAKARGVRPAATSVRGDIKRNPVTSRQRPASVRDTVEEEEEDPLKSYNAGRPGREIKQNTRPQQQESYQRTRTQAATPQDTPNSSLTMTLSYIAHVRDHLQNAEKYISEIEAGINQHLRAHQSSTTSI